MPTDHNIWREMRVEMESNWDPSAYQLELTIFFFFPFLDDDDDELMLNVLRCHLTY